MKKAKAKIKEKESLVNPNQAIEQVRCRASKYGHPNGLIILNKWVQSKICCNYF